MSETAQSFLITLIAMIPGILALILGRRKQAAEASLEEADASVRFTKAALALVEPLKKRIEEMVQEIADLHGQVDRLQAEQAELICGIDKLIAQIKAQGQEPVWRPKRKPYITSE